jgi:hypothetical protein
MGNDKGQHSAPEASTYHQLSQKQDASLWREVIPYVLPFVLFALLTYLGPALDLSPLVIYPIKTALVGALLAVFWKKYRKEIVFTLDGYALLGGVLVFAVWVGLEGMYPQLGGAKEGFDPTSLSVGSFAFFVSVRMLGAALVVPLMEELFWRSFAMRFLIETRFTSIPLGMFSAFSFGAVALAFGFEHARWLPGIIAGLVYAGLLCRTRNLFSPILSHAVTNALLGIYVLATGSWAYW